MALTVNTRALEALQEHSELQRLRLAMSAADAASYDWTLSNDHLEWSDNAPLIFGAQAYGTLTTGLGLQESVDERFRAAIDDAIAQSVVDGDPFRIEYILSLGDSGSIWVEDCGLCLRDKNGNATRIIGSMRNITERKVLEERLVYLASYDELTGHLNRASIRDVLDEVAILAAETKVSAGFMVVAIDHLGIINEDFGYDIADEVILNVCDRIAANIGEDDVIGRLGGNKFGVILADCASEELATVAAAILEFMRRDVVRTSTGVISVSVSIGGVTIPGSAGNAADAIGRAEEALAQVKQVGRDAFRQYVPSARKETLRRQNISMGDQIIKALEDDRIWAAYQPIICSTTGETAMYECLARMALPDGELCVAADWIPVAERLSLIDRVDQRIAEIAINTLKREPNVSLALNVSAYTASDGEWLRRFLSLIADAPQAASRLTVELTETLALTDLEESCRFISQLREAGCRVAIDDFGAGYTSFKNLQKLNIDLVKIDGAFAVDLSHSPDNQLFIKTLVTLAHNFDVGVVAEWVANEEDAGLLREMGVDYFQGFLYGTPTLQPKF